MKGYFDNQLRRTTTEDISPLQHWYQKSMVPGLNFLPNIQADTQLPFWVFTKNLSNTRHNTICPHCQQDLNPIHYLIDCPAHAACDPLTLSNTVWGQSSNYNN